MELNYRNVMSLMHAAAQLMSALHLFLSKVNSSKVITTTHCVKQFAFIVCSRSSYLLSLRLKQTFEFRHWSPIIDHFTFGLKVQFGELLQLSNTIFHFRCQIEV